MLAESSIPCDMEMIDLKAPESWSELTLDQLKTVVRLMRLHLTREEFLLALFLNFTGVKKADGSFIAADGRRFTMTDVQVMDFCNRLSFILDEMPCDIANPTKVNGHLNDISFGAYFNADSLMYAYHLHCDKDMVRMALFNLEFGRLEHGKPMYESPKKVKIEEVDDDYADLVSLWWTGVQQWLKEQYPHVFADGEGTGEAYSPLKARQNILLMLNEGKPQDNDRIEQSQVHDVLGALEYRIEQARAMEMRMK